MVQEQRSENGRQEISESASLPTSGSMSPTSVRSHRRSASFSQNFCSASSAAQLTASMASLRPPIVREFSLAGWTFQTVRSSISSASQIEMLSHELDFPLPTMFFGSNRVILRSPKDFELYFDPIEAVKSVSKSSEAIPARIAASHADFWRQKNESEPIFEYDWTYTPQNYFGKMKGESIQIAPDSLVSIDYDRLKQQDPILFFDENILYEDELGDNGISILSVKIRVMSYGFYVLLNQFLRVDQVSFKSTATRYYHEFSNDFVVREVRHSEDTFSSISEKLILSGHSFKDTEVVIQMLPITLTIIEKISF